MEILLFNIYILCGCKKKLQGHNLFFFNLAVISRIFILQFNKQQGFTMFKT